MIHLQRFANKTLGAGNLGIDVAGSNVDELSADIRKKRLEAKPLFDSSVPNGL